ncbi:hypothetical protein SteCoe_32615 [Stentor coeruleus]|uniref:ALA-interacting subunit n=1 Tax=Stentor coeruleus TaxID=5963 RepID=A0A1R2AYM8_9CILI|nr:hypothetical protein SteCoe_32615 [Stentor coeruleus]
MELENKPPNTPLAQQRMKYWKLNLSNLHKGIMYNSCGMLLIILGILLILASESVIEYSKRYDDLDSCKPRKGLDCEIEFHITEHMKGDVFLYYQINNMYQNHRKYSKSLNPKQLKGSDLSKDDIESTCDPVLEIKNLHRDIMVNLSRTDVANPCGLVAKSYFNDTFSLYQKDSNKTVKIHENDIAFPRDKDDKFRNSSDVDKKRWTDVTDEHFIVWNSIAVTKNFRKLWGRINGLDKGRYIMKINSLYDVSDFNGEKHVVLTTLSVLGGKMPYLGILCIAIGVSSIVGSVVFFILHRKIKKEIDSSMRSSRISHQSLS